MENLNTLFLANASAQGGSNWMMIILLVVLFAFTYFGMIRPQKKQQQKRMQMMDDLKKGDEVVLVDGLHAKVDKINNDKTIVVDADGIYLTFERMAVRRIIPAQAPAQEPSATPAAEAKPADSAKSDAAPKETEAAPESNDTEKTEDK